MTISSAHRETRGPVKPRSPKGREDGAGARLQRGLYGVGFGVMIVFRPRGGAQRMSAVGIRELKTRLLPAQVTLHLLRKPVHEATVGHR